MSHGLPWLPLPSQADHEALKAIGVNGLPSLISLAGRRWSAAEWAVIGRKAQKFIAAQGAEWRGAAKHAALTPFTLLIFSSQTAAHILQPLTAMALTRGILLNCRLVEYQEPEVWFGANEAAIGEIGPDAILLAMDRNALGLHATLGDSQGATAAVEAALGRIAALSRKFSALTGRPVIVENLPGNASDAQGNIDAWLAGAPRYMTTLFNMELARAASGNAFLLMDTAGVADLVGQDGWHGGRYWYMAKMAFSPACVPIYAHRLVGLLAAMSGRSRRVLVLDLDNTLWGGIIGDDGLEGLRIGGTSAVGRAHTELQKMALAYKERGILLCVASKNTHAVAIEAFRTHPEMLIREDDITLFSVNWENKAANIRAMAENLNLGLEAFVFVDDNPAERKQVRDVLPTVAVPELPEDPTLWLPIIQAAGYFEQTGFSEEDRKRAAYYKGNVQRQALRGAAGDEKGFLESLNMVMTVAPFDAVGRQRIAQLIAKSNQFNLTTRRYSEVQVAELEHDDMAETLQIRLEDIFGDNGMISVIICRKGAESWEIDTWLMSCRVLGRHVEKAALDILVRRAAAAGATELRGSYVPTAKNGIVSEHYEKLGFTKVGGDGDSSIWSLQFRNYTPPDLPMRVIERPA